MIKFLFRYLIRIFVEPFYADWEKKIVKNISRQMKKFLTTKDWREKQEIAGHIYADLRFLRNQSLHALRDGEIDHHLKTMIGCVVDSRYR